MGLKVKYLVSDRAKAIVKLALKDLGTASIADLFHVLYNLNRSLALELNCLAAKLQKQLKMEKERCEINLVHWVKDYLLPAVYWQQQVQRTKNPELRQDYQAASKKTQEFLRMHPVTISLSPKEREQWQHWAIWMSSKFQRCSSAVEGRNGYLSQVHHNRRGLSSTRLKVSTVIHNFALKRSDGTTAAERLFGRKFPDLFEYLENNLGELPQPRRSRKSSHPQTFTLPTVPS